MPDVLHDILSFLQKQEKKSTGKAFFPALWDCSLDRPSSKTIKLNPYKFYAKTLSYILNKKFNIALNKEFPNCIYGAHLRSLTAFEHKSTLLSDNGTFIKTILLLPYLKFLGVDSLYLLPVNKPSWHNLKGNLPSPYATKSFCDFDPILDEPLLGNNFSMEEQFEALVKACHISGIKVIMDFVFRTVGRDHDWIFKHPDWFYWIPKAEEKSFKAPEIKHLAYDNPDTIISKQIMESDIPLMFKNDLSSYLKLFQNLSNTTIKELNTKTSLTKIEEKLNITTAPAFSDWFNDHQAPWTDITYLRFYLDHPKPSKAYLKDYQAPYLLYDTIHCDQVEGEIINEILWNELENIIPYYQNKYQIDGARIDMAHSMPKKLMDRIISTAKQNNSNFIFISEDFNMSPEVSLKRKKHYDLFLGNLWFYEAPNELNNLQNILHNDISKLHMPLLATSETPDTPRTAAREAPCPNFSKLMFLLNSFLPNSTLFINAGFELLETTSLNGALASPEDSNKNEDVAFFNNATMNWERTSAIEMLTLIRKLYEIRKQCVAKPSIKSLIEDKYLIIEVSPYVILYNLTNEKLPIPKIYRNKKVILSLFPQTKENLPGLSATVYKL